MSFSRSRMQRAYSSPVGSWEYVQYNKLACDAQSPAWRVVSNGSLGAFQVGKFSCMLDCVSPGFNRRASRGEVFFNPMDQTTLEIDAGSGSNPVEFTSIAPSCGAPYSYYQRHKFTISGVTFGRATSGFTYPVWPDGTLRPFNSFLSPSDVSAAISEASTACLNGRGRANSNLYETLAEMDSIIGTIPGIVKPFLKALSQNRGLLDRARGIGSAYLAYRYGLKPLMSDLVGVVEGLQKAVGRVRQTSRGSSSLSIAKSEFSSGGWGGACTFDKLYTHREDLIVRAMSLDEFEASVASNAGFTAKGLLTLPWELLPYSFVVDWFANIGDFVGSLVPSFGYSQLGSCLVLDNKLVTEYRIGTTYPRSDLALDVPITGTNVRTWIHKSRTTQPLTPGLVLRSDFRFSNLTRAADAISLILQKIK